MLSRTIYLLSSFFESLRMALDAMWTHKMRSLLTLIGVVIGVTTIIGMMTVLGGIKYSIDEAWQNSLSPNVFQVQKHDNQAGIHFGPRRRVHRPDIEPEYAEAILEHCPSVRRVGVEAWTFGRSIRRGGLETNLNQQIAGGSVEFGDNNGYYVDRGRGISRQDISSARRVIVLGHDAVKTLFSNIDPVGEYVRVGAYRFEVVGTFEERGTFMGGSRDDFHWIPLSTFFRIYGDRSVNLTVQAWSTQVYDQAQQEVIEAMRVERGLKPGEPNNFGMWTPSMLNEQFNQSTQFVGFAGFGISAVALLVAGIGIMNIMLVSVTERTREIGVRKALGGTRLSILRQFLIEAVILSEVGGVIGIFLGYGIAIGINNWLNFPAPVPVWSVFLAIIFCSIVGIGFGMWPAIKAARLDPIDALRWE